ncbi:MAG: UbiX family flavin prenyltransferase [Spirochaetes bacterium]|jgi:4-hydroxy-3-polyprenylbenzoate decarboxylase|nr:UbiX family flavin prenyltransferase [Spirochaetota bacterium]
MYIVGITGASGSIIGIRLIEELLKTGERVGGIISDAGLSTMNYELYGSGEKTGSIADCLAMRGTGPAPGRFEEYSNRDFFAPPASGTSVIRGVIIAPASMKTLSSVANGYSDSLISRAADVCLKEGRRCILVARETPLSLIHIENMRRAKMAGADILPPVPAFYTHPKSVDDIVNFTVGKILSLLGFEHELYRKWDEREGRDD